MTRPEDLDLSVLRGIWDARRAKMRDILRRFDTRGMTRPARDPDERAWLAARGEIAFDEDEAAGAAAREYYARRYRR